MVLLALVLCMTLHACGASAVELAARPSVDATAAVTMPVAATPPMGWNSWNAFREKLDESLVKEIASALVRSGLAAQGYVYVNMDDTWAGPRDNATQALVPQPKKFPSGMAALTSYVHAKQLKFGIYTDVGHLTCAKAPGTWGHETLDAQTFAAWNVDYVKSDSCFTSPGGSPGAQPADGPVCATRYALFDKALKATGRAMVHSIKGPCGRNASEPCSPPDSSSIANARRASGDARNSWSSMVSIIEAAAPVVQYSRPGYFADLDILEIGNGVLTLVEEKTVFSMWCALKSPLLLGNDVRSMTKQTLDVVTNAALIRVNQDALALAAKRVAVSGEHNETQVWTGPLSGGATVLLLLNVGNASTTVSTSLGALGIAAGASVKATDLWSPAAANVTYTSNIARDVEAHGVVALRLVPAAQS